MLSKLAWLCLISTPHFLFLKKIEGVFAVLQTCKITGVHNSHSRVVNQRQESAAVLPFELWSRLDPDLKTTFSTCSSTGDKGKELEVAPQKRISNNCHLSRFHDLSIQKNQPVCTIWFFLFSHLWEPYQKNCTWLCKSGYFCCTHTVSLTFHRALLMLMCSSEGRSCPQSVGFTPSIPRSAMHAKSDIPYLCCSIK